jgi:hypothetical protein
MAGGTAGLLQSHYPAGDDSVVCIQSAPLTFAAAAVTDYRWCEIEAPFAFMPISAQVSIAASIDADADAKMSVKDDSGTPKVIVNAQSTGAAVTAGAAVRRTLAVDPKVKILKGALIRFEVTTLDAADAFTDAVVYLFVHPVI